MENPFAAKRRKFFLPIRSSTFCTNTLLHNTTTFHLASKSQILLNTNRKNNSLYIFPPSELKKIHRYSNRPSKDTRDTRMDIASTLTSGSKIGKSSWGGGTKRGPRQMTGTPFSFVRRGEIETANRARVDGGWKQEEEGACVEERGIIEERTGWKSARREGNDADGGRDSIKRTHINESFQGKTELYDGVHTIRGRVGKEGSRVASLCCIYTPPPPPGPPYDQRFGFG